MESSITVVVSRPMRLSTMAASAKNAIIPQKATAPTGEVNHFENSNSANPAAASNAGGHHGDLRNSRVATAAVSASGPAKRAQPCAQGTRSLEVSYRPTLMTNTSPVVAADQMALAKDQSAGSSKMAPAANAAFPYCSKLKRFMGMLVEAMASCCRRGGQCARTFLSRGRRASGRGCVKTRDQRVFGVLKPFLPLRSSILNRSERSTSEMTSSTARFHTTSADCSRSRPRSFGPAAALGVPLASPWNRASTSMRPQTGAAPARCGDRSQYSIRSSVRTRIFRAGC